MKKSTATRSEFDLTSVRTVAGGRALAPYAVDAFASKGRLIAEPSSPTRTDFQRDRDRIIHSNAFKRLKHKTQVFVFHEGDHYRTRLTHTIEVGQIARALARALKVDEDLAEALALVHDFGHTPFGHAGERVLNEKLAAFGGFDHNAQSLRVVTELERRYAEFDGLNLCWETLEGLVKHNGPLVDKDGDGLDGPVPRAISDYNQKHDLLLWSWPSVEAQCAAIADDIAYDNHDLEDGLREGLFAIEDLAEVPICLEILKNVQDQYPHLDKSRTIHEIVRRQITLMVEDVIQEAVSRLEQAKPTNAQAVRELDYAAVQFSPEMEQQEKVLKAFMFERMYRHKDVVRPVEASQIILSDLFDAFQSGRAELPEDTEWALDGLDDSARAHRIADYLAGMTDRYAVNEHKRWFDHTPELG
jgi:dGTPase